MKHCFIAAAVSILALASGADAVLLNFEELTATSNYSQGVVVPANARLSNQYQATNGILFSSGSPFVGVANLGTAATSGTHGFGGTSSSGTFDYAAPITFSFTDPNNATAAAVTDFFSLRGDKDPTGGGAGIAVTVRAYDVNGVLLGSNTQVDTGGETWTLSFPGIHSVVYPGTSANPASGGIALDDVSFNPVTPALPEPAGLAFFVFAAAALNRRRRLGR